MDQNRSKSLNNPINSDFITKEEEIDFAEIFKSISRNKKIVFIFCFFSLIFSSILVLNTRRTYQGEFQIVLAKETPILQQNSKSARSAFNIALNTSNKLKTEVGILKSPSVLMDIFEYVKKEKLLRNDDSYENMRFKSWREGYLDIKLQKGTSILNLAYKDNDKDLILPVLNKISNAYQSYSGEKRLREIELDTEFLNNQIVIYKSKIKNSQEEMERYGNRYNLSIIENIKTEKTSIPIINVEALKNQIFNLDSQLALQRSIYSEGDEKIQNTIRLKNAFIESAKRPKGVVIKYRQLINEVERDKRTLIELENNLTLIGLEKARYKDPWRLLTKPTLLPNPIAPRRKRFVLIGGIIGLLIGSLIAFRYEKNKGIIFSVEEMQSLTGLPLISELNLKNNDSWNDTLYLIIYNLISEKKEKIGILLTNEIDNLLLRKIEKNLEDFIKSNQIILTSDVKKLDQCNKLVFLASLGMTTKNSLINIKDRILFKENKLIGILILNNL